MSILQMSITAGMLILGIILYRILFLHRLPKKVIVILWEIAVLRLLLPVSVHIPMPEFPIWNTERIQTEGLMEKTEAVKEENEIPAENKQSMETPGYRKSGLKAGMGIQVLYGAGVFLMVAGSIFIYARDRRIFREGLPMPEEDREGLLTAVMLTAKEKEYLKKIRLQISDRTATPVTYGIFCPAIIFPKGMSRGQETGFCIRHELVHIRNHDNLKKLIMHAALCIHWFNPLVWVMYLFFNRDLELLCDETVIRKGEESRKDYALALLSMAQQRNSGFLTGLGFGKNAVKERIEAIMKIKEITFAGVIAAVIVVVLSLISFVTAAEKKDILSVKESSEEELARKPDEIDKELEILRSYQEELQDEGIDRSVKRLVEKYQEYGLNAEYTDNDYQLYYNGEPVYFFADNRNFDGKHSFEGTLFSRVPNDENGYTGVVTRYDEERRLIGLERLSEEESKAFSDRYIW